MGLLLYLPKGSKMNINKEWLKAAKEGDKAAMSALADYYEEIGNVIAAAQWRAKAGLSRITYQVIDKVTNKVDREYKTIGACKGFINRFNDYDVRQRKIVKLLEYRCTVVGEVEFDKESVCGTWYDKGQVVEITNGEHKGKRGVIVGQKRNPTVSQSWAPGGILTQIMIDGTVHLMSKQDYHTIEG